MFRRHHVEEEQIPESSVKLVPARVYTSSGWIVGKLHASADWSLANFLDHSPEFISLADTTLEGRPKVIPLFTLHRSAILFLVVETEEALESDKDPRNLLEHTVSFLLGNGTLYGRISVMKGVRLSVYLSRKSGFILVRDCHFRLQNPWEEQTFDHHEASVFLNPQAVVGVSESAEDD